jgi:methylaspartate ammonia-lyase
MCSIKIKYLLCAEGKTGFYFDDQQAIKSGATLDGATYLGTPVTDGFTSVRQSGEAITVIIVLENGQYAYGDCAAVQYSGTGGRDKLFLAKDFIPVILETIKPLLVNKEITNFRDMANMIDSLRDKDGKLLHTAIRYGVTQAILDAVAKSKNKLMAQIIADEYNLTISEKMIPIFSQSGDDRYNNADKMIMKSASILPHALFNNVEEKLGINGEKLKDYIKWLRDRIIEKRKDNTYNPVLHVDVYGTIGVAFNNDIDKITNYMGELEKIATPFKLRVEGPVDPGNREEQMNILKELRIQCEQKNINVEIVADEWCNTFEDVKYFTDNKAGHMAQIKTPDLGGINNSIEAVLYCKQNGMGAYLGGTCNETNRSAEVCAHIAMATSPVQYLAKPGMGVDEGYMIVFNEMQRILMLKDIL